MSHFDISMLITIAIGFIFMVVIGNRPFAITSAVLAVGLTIMLTIKRILNRKQSHS